MQLRPTLFFIVVWATGSFAYANIVGTDFQTFNPTTDGIDFVTVDAAQTLATGVIEVKANTKYQFMGDQNQGLAAILSLNQNLIANDPFSGSGAGPTFNFQ